MKTVKNIVVHCSASPWGCAREIRKWHLERGFKDLGYHFVLLNGMPGPGLYLPSLDGSVECGRMLDGDRFIEDNEQGAHALGYNENSIGICVIGEEKNGVKTFTVPQMEALKKLLYDLCKQYGVSVENVIGHNETSAGKAQGKTCPCFDVGAFRMWLKGRV